MFKSSGRLIYDPTIELRTNTTTEDWWLILRCDEEIARYYRWLIAREHHVDHLVRPVLLKPAWGAHISILRGEKPTHPEFWKKDHGSMIRFEYSGKMRNNGKHFWLDIESDDIADIRDRLGLGRKPKFSNFHLTVGNWDLPPLTPEQEQARLAAIRDSKVWVDQRSLTS